MESHYALFTDKFLHSAHLPKHLMAIGAVRHHVLQAATKRSGLPEVLIIDDTGFPKKGRHSVGVARQYCGQLGKQDNCQVAVSLSLANEHYSVPVGYRL